MQKFNINLVKSFLSAFISFEKNKFEIVNRCHSPKASYGNEDEVRSNPIYVDCSPKAGFSLTPFAMTIKNNFANLNLVKSFLTSITFDSLSRKIKIPCLVINKNSFLRRIFMKNIKQFFTYLVVGALVMALSISCKSNEEPTDNTHSNHPPSGTYSGRLTIGGSSINTIATVTTSGGTCNIKGIAYNIYDTTDTKQYDITITKWLYSADGNGDYVRAGSISPSGEATINAPKGATDFAVRYIAGSIQLSFNLYDKTYDTAYNMTRQQ